MPLLLFEHDEDVGRELVLLVLVEVVYADPLELALAEQLERLRLGQHLDVAEAQG